MADVTKPGLGGDDWAPLTIAERITRCEEYAREADTLADLSPHAEERFRKVAAQWRQLAAELKQR
jgi:hypothetical protein